MGERLTRNELLSGSSLLVGSLFSCSIILRIVQVGGATLSAALSITANSKNREFSSTLSGLLYTTALGNGLFHRSNGTVLYARQDVTINVDGDGNGLLA